MSTSPIEAITAIVTAHSADPLSLPQVAPAAQHPHVSFAQMISDGVDKVSDQAANADALARAFVLDDSIAPHRVMYALEQSHLSLQIMMQVRNRLVEGYQEIMRMQL